ncbi:MAG: hypothetical protein AAF850_11845 [Pseudomonadota bacterium]
MTQSLERRYRLTLTGAPGRRRARIEVIGPRNPAQILIGMPIDQAIRVVSALYPICPYAHELAARRAVSFASAPVESVRFVALEQVLLSTEALVAAAWRAGMVWSPLLGRTPMLHEVAATRRAGDKLVSLTKDANKRDDFAGELDDALQEFVGALDAFSGISAAMAEACDEIAIPTECQGVFQDAINRSGSPVAATAPDGSDRGTDKKTFRLSLMFAAIAERMKYHSAALADAIAQLRDRVKRPIEAPSARATLGDGQGVGSVETIRGELTHSVRLIDGHVAAWRVLAPTDIAFAEKGPVVTLANALGKCQIPEKAYDLLVAAFDPCAPCDIDFQTSPVTSLAYA